MLINLTSFDYIDLFGLAEWGAVTSISWQALPVAKLMALSGAECQHTAGSCSQRGPTFNGHVASWSQNRKNMFSGYHQWHFLHSCSLLYSYIILGLLYSMMKFRDNAIVMLSVLVDAAVRWKSLASLVRQEPSSELRSCDVQTYESNTEDVRDERQALLAVAGWFWIRNIENLVRG